VDECEGLGGFVCGCASGADVFVEEEGGLIFWGLKKSDFQAWHFFSTFVIDIKSLLKCMD